MKSIYSCLRFAGCAHTHTHTHTHTLLYYIGKFLGWQFSHRFCYNRITFSEAQFQIYIYNIIYWFHHLTECESVYEPALISCLLLFPKNLVINVALFFSASYLHSRKCFRHTNFLILMILWTNLTFFVPCIIV